MNGQLIVDAVGSAALTLLALTIGLSFIRLYKGPSLPDRVVALDLLTTVGIAITAVYAVITGRPVILDVATILALISFLGTIAFAYYIDLRQ
jgi:multicomponent Na+:H+ antiporter subunit F